jgi:catechol O-methyltransferase
MTPMSGRRRRLPLLRWSFLRMGTGMKRVKAEGRLGDGREDALADHVVQHARAGDVDDVIRTIDDFAYSRIFLMNVGDRKGELLDAAVRRAQPQLVLELGTYCGYSSLRMARVLPAGGRIVSVEFSEANAAVARRVLEHAGVSDRVTVVVGHLGDGGSTLDALEAEHGFQPGGLDLVFLDHDKKAYLPDLQRVLQRGWLRRGALAVADNVRFPGAPEYRAYMSSEQGRTWQTVEHPTYVEYQEVIKDLVLESEYLPA